MSIIFRYRVCQTEKRRQICKYFGYFVHQCLILLYKIDSSINNKTKLLTQEKLYDY